MKLADHPTVRHFHENQANRAAGPPQALDSAWLRQLALDCGADDAGLVGECADLIYHLIVLLRARELDWSDVRSELARRARA